MGENREYDRSYAVGVAFEFNRPQHYRATRAYPNPQQVDGQVAQQALPVQVIRLESERIAGCLKDNGCKDRMDGKGRRSTGREGVGISGYQDYAVNTFAGR